MVLCPVASVAALTHLTPNSRSYFSGVLGLSPALTAVQSELLPTPGHVLSQLFVPRYLPNTKIKQPAF